MGSACTTPEIAEQVTQSKRIDRALRKEQDDEIGNQKLLLLGTGECGKSTILKQMRILHKDGFSDQDLDDKKEVVYSNILSGVAACVQAVDKFMYPYGNVEREMDARRILAIVEAGKDSQPFTPDVYSALKALWADSAIQKAFARRNEFQVGDSLSYFMDDLGRIGSSTYRPSVTDILHLRVPTAGVVQVQFPIKGCTFRVFDVGGQRSERRKWIHLFDDVNAIIFISAINEYDQVLQEDLKTNRLMESLDLFAQICNSKWFIKASMILFLNKKDLFEEKIKHTSIKVLFPHYKDENTYQASMDYIRHQFHRLNEHKKTKKIYTHETCATNTNQVQFVIDSVVDTVIGKNLRGTGME